MNCLKNKSITGGKKVSSAYAGSLRAVPAGVITFYLAMGVTQTYLAYAQREKNPTALDDFGGMFTIPVAASMAGFIGASYPIMKGAILPAGGKAGLWTGLPRFTVGIQIGMMASQVIYVLMSDTDVQKFCKTGDTEALNRKLTIAGSASTAATIFFTCSLPA